MTIYCEVKQYCFFSCTSGYVPNGVHAVEAMLAAASIGAIWSSTSVDFGVNVSVALRNIHYVEHDSVYA